MKTFRFLIILAALFLCLIPQADAYQWERLTEEQRAFCKPHMTSLVETYRTEGSDAALSQLEGAYVLAESEFPDTTFFYRIIWWEAQGQTGRDNEEWGIELYRFLMEHNHRRNPQSAIKIPANDYILYGNISEALRDLGKAAQARAIILQVEESQCKHRNMDTSCTAYKDLGPIFSFMPDARKRAFPIYYQDLQPESNDRSTKPHFIYYPYIYGIGYAAISALESGDWVRAAELNQWFIRYTDEYMKGDNHMKHEVCKCSVDATRRLAQICLMHGHPEEAARFYEEFIAKAEGYYHAAPIRLYDAKLELELVKIELGTLTDDALEIADEAAKIISERIFYSRLGVVSVKLKKARIYHALGRAQEAWDMIDHLFTETAVDVNPYLKIHMLRTAIDLALADGGIHPKLEKWLILALENERRMGNKFGELSLYEKYAQFLAINGLYEEAVAIQREVVRLAKAMNLPDRLVSAQAVLDQLSNRLPAPESAKTPIPETPATESKSNDVQATPATSDPQPKIAPENRSGISGQRTHSAEAVNIQPSLSLTAALPGQPAHGRFYLINPSANTVQGELHLTGRIDLLKWQNENWLTIGSSPAFPETALSRPLTLAAGAICVIDITGLPDNNEPDVAVECSWMAHGETVATSHWSYRESTSGKRTAVIDAHEIQSNPFYLVPIHHMIQRKEKGKAEWVDLTVEASSPMRIEAYDELTGKLLYIDANGDGDFEDEGDLVTSDANRNNWPDILFGANQHLASVVLYVKPEAGQKEEQELTVKLLDNETWRIDAVDVIK